MYLMNGKIFTKFILSAVLISAFFTTFLSAPVSMPMMGMITMDSQMNNHRSSQKTDDNDSTMRCCEVIGVTCVSPALITPQFGGIALSGENKRVINSNPAVHFIVIQNTTPPPKA